MKLFIGGIPPGLDEVDLKEMFELYGDVTSAMIVKDRNTGKSKGFGFLDMPNAIEAMEALNLLNGVTIFGKRIAVKEAEDTLVKKQPDPSAPGSGFLNRRPLRKRI